MLPRARPRNVVANSRRPILCVLVALFGGAGGCAGRQLAAGVRAVRVQAQEARANGAMRCAPRELALAETHSEFSARELDEGDYFRARDHLRIAEDNAKEALRLSPRDRCLPSAPGQARGQDHHGDGDEDRDADGIPDATDKCPAAAEDKDGFEDADGCPDPDNDQDGIADADDRCPGAAEDKDGFEDADGCPDPDNDQDGIADVDDKCPLEAGPPDTGGCPKTYDHITVTGEKIELKQKVFFETDKAVIMARSYDLLAEIANVLRTRPTMRLRIEGHTDARGTVKHNMTLSQSRAEAVRVHLVGLGIDGTRLEARGFGPEQPIETNRTGSGRERNRRVEFVITQQ